LDESNRFRYLTPNQYSKWIRRITQELCSPTNYTGKCVVNGEAMELSAWVKTSKAGEKYLSVAFKKPYNANTSTQANVLHVGGGDLPF